MRTNHVQPQFLAKGNVGWRPDARRVTALVDVEIFELLRQKAIDEHSSVSAVAARLLTSLVIATGPRS